MAAKALSPSVARDLTAGGIDCLIDLRLCLLFCFVLFFTYFCLFICVLKYRNKKWPYETDCSETKRLAGFERYTSEGCFFECLSNATASKCGCRVPSDSGKSC